jgi:hypothetical protein
MEEEAAEEVKKKMEEEAAAPKKKLEAAAKKEEEEVAKTDAAEIDGLAAAVARANLGTAVVTGAAAWIAAAGARSVAQLESDDIDGASLKARPPPLRMTAWAGAGLACLFVCLCRSGAVRCGVELV